MERAGWRERGRERVRGRDGEQRSLTIRIGVSFRVSGAEYFIPSAAASAGTRRTGARARARAAALFNDRHMLSSSSAVSHSHDVSEGGRAGFSMVQK